jgi:toxin-antitoxin system PIN domain toxin
VILIDVNVLVYACRRDAARHTEYRRWLTSTLGARELVGIAPESLGAVVRITTHRRIWKEPLSIDEALTFTSVVREARPVIPVQPGARHWALFSTLCRESKARGNLATDAWLAALAIEHGCTLVTTDRDFARFKGLRWEHPLDA